MKFPGAQTARCKTHKSNLPQPMRDNSLSVPRLVVFGKTYPTDFAETPFNLEKFNLFIC